MRKKLKLHRETLRTLSGPNSLRAAVGQTNSDHCTDSTGGCPYTGESMGWTFCYPTRLDGCWNTQQTQCQQTNFSFCVCDE